MDVSGVSSSVAAAQQVSTSASIEVQKKTEDLQKQVTSTLLEALPDPSSPVGQNVNIKV